MDDRAHGGDDGTGDEGEQGGGDDHPDADTSEPDAGIERSSAGSERASSLESYPIDRRALIGGLGAGLVGLAGCTGDGGDDGGGGNGTDGMGGNGTDGGGGGGGASIDATGVWSDAEAQSFQAVIDHVEGQTNLSIEYHPRTTDALLTGTLMDYSSGVAPADVVVMPSPARVRSDGRNGHVEPLGDLWGQENYIPDPGRVSADGEVYAAPFKMDLKPGFWYRQSFFEENGLSEPESYDDFLSLLDTISGVQGVSAPIASGNGSGWPLSDVTEGFILRQENGAQLQRNLISGDADFTDQRVQSALQEVQELLQAGYFSQVRDFGVQYEYFWSNELPLYFMGSFTPGFEAIQDPEDLGFFRLPGTSGIVASVNWFTVPTYSDNVEAATTAVEQFISPEGQRVWAGRGGFIGSSSELSSDAYDLQIMADLASTADEATVVPDLDDALGNPFQQEFWSQLKGLWSSPGTDLAQMTQRLDEVQNEALQGGNGSS